MMVVPDGAQQPDMAFEYSRFICGLEAQVQKLVLVKQVSPRLDFYNTPEWGQAVEELPQLAAVPAIGAAGKPYPFFRRYTAANAHFPIVQDAMRGESDLDLRGAGGSRETHCPGTRVVKLESRLRGNNERGLVSPWTGRCNAGNRALSRP